MPFITEQTKCLSVLHKHHPEILLWKDNARWWDCIHLHNIVSGFLVTEPLSHYVFSHEVFSCYYQHCWDISRHWSFCDYTQICWCYIELYSHQIWSVYKVFCHHDPWIPEYCDMEKILENNWREINNRGGNGRAHRWHFELHIQWCSVWMPSDYYEIIRQTDGICWGNSDSTLYVTVLRRSLKAFPFLVSFYFVSDYIKISWGLKKLWKVQDRYCLLSLM